MRMIASEWVYRAEGNNNIVFANAHSPYLLRLPKARTRRQADERETSSKEMEFLESVVYEILDQYALHFRARKVRVTKQFLQELSVKLRGVRRSEPHQGDELDEGAAYGMVMENFCLSLLQLPSLNDDKSTFDHLTDSSGAPLISIELRPKSCYTPMFSQRPGTLAQGKCFFCLTKIYQKENEPTEPNTDYCPFDLYSNDQKRMKRALRDLIAGSERYFSVRVDDQPVQFAQHFTDKVSRNKSKDNLDILSTAISEALGQNGSSGHEMEAFLNVVCSILQAPIGHRASQSATTESQPHCRRASKVKNPSSSPSRTHSSSSMNVLGLLSDIQSMRNVPINVIMDADEKLRQHLLEHPEDSSFASLDAPYDVELWKTSMYQPSCDCQCRTTAPIQPQLSDEHSRKIFRLACCLRRFIVARIFSCCSLILSFQRLSADEARHPTQRNSSKSFVVRDGFGNKYLAAIAILDLYKDPPDQISKYCQRDLKILSNLNNYL